MRVIAIALAVVFFVLGILYGMGKINLFTESGAAHTHHITHLVVFWVLALLCLDLGAVPERDRGEALAHRARRQPRRWSTSPQERHVAHGVRRSARSHEPGGADARSRAATLPKGDAFVAAQIAGIMAAKQTAALIPLAHPLPLSSVDVRFDWRARRCAAHRGGGAHGRANRRRDGSDGRGSRRGADDLRHVESARQGDHDRKRPAGEKSGGKSGDSSTLVRAPGT